MVRQKSLAGPQISEAQACVTAMLPSRVRSMAQEVMSMPLKSVAKVRHQVWAAPLRTVAVVCMAVGLDRQDCQGVLHSKQLALLGLAGCPQALHLVGRRCPLASALRLLSEDVASHLPHRKV